MVKGEFKFLQCFVEGWSGEKAAKRNENVFVVCGTVVIKR